MKWKLVTFADEKYREQQIFINSVAKTMGMATLPFTEKDLEGTNLYSSDVAGAGYWIWKPYVILEALNQSNEDDIIMYCDCGDAFHPELKQYVEKHIDDTCLLVLGGAKNSEWTKRDCFVYMNCDEKDYWDCPQLESGISFWRVSETSKKIVSEWLEYCKDIRISGNSENVSGENNLPGFKEHRNDQSVLTNIACRDGLLVDSGGIRNYIECNYDYWIERNEKYGFTLGRPIDSFLLKLKKIKDSGVFEITF